MKIPLPNKLKVEEGKNNIATITVEPCFPGYGVTLGNSLRRVLLSSIDGAAITAVKIQGAAHDFSSLPYVKEDLVQIILNIKKIRLKVYSDEPVILKLNVSGAKEVKASDIEKNAEVEIISQDQPIATLTDKSAKFEMELIAQKGMGYVPVEEREGEKLEVGYIMIDAFYSPIVKVGFEINNIRVGDQTNYEKLLVHLETDGSLTPEEAFQKASLLLLNHFDFILTQVGGERLAPVEENKDSETDEAEIVNEPEETEEKPKKRGRPKKKE